MTQEKLALPCLVLNMLLTMLASSTQQTWAQTVHGPNPYLAPYLLQEGELPDGAVMPRFHEIWRIVGNDLNATNFTAKVDYVSETIFAAYSYQGKATGSRVSYAAATHVDGQLRELFVCTVILCKHVCVYQRHGCLSVHASSRSDVCSRQLQSPMATFQLLHCQRLAVLCYACNAWL